MMSSVVVVFEKARWLKIHARSDSDELSISKRFSWEDVHPVRDRTQSATYHNSGIHEVFQSDLAMLVSNDYYDCKHYVLYRPGNLYEPQHWVEIVASSFSWVLVEPQVV